MILFSIVQVVVGVRPKNDLLKLVREEKIKERLRRRGLLFPHFGGSHFREPAYVHCLAQARYAMGLDLDVTRQFK